MRLIDTWMHEHLQYALQCVGVCNPIVDRRTLPPSPARRVPVYPLLSSLYSPLPLTSSAPPHLVLRMPSSPPHPFFSSSFKFLHIRDVSIPQKYADSSTYTTALNHCNQPLDSTTVLYHCTLPLHSTTALCHYTVLGKVSTNKKPLNL